MTSTHKDKTTNFFMTELVNPKTAEKITHVIYEEHHPKAFNALLELEFATNKKPEDITITGSIVHTGPVRTFQIAN